MQNRPELSMDISENLSKQGEALLGILQDWVQVDIRFDPRIAQIIANRLGVQEHESWIIAAVMMMSTEIPEHPPQHPDYDRLHQGRGADLDYGALGRDG